MEHLEEKGLSLNLKDDANDYVGKGLSGAIVSIKLSEESNLNSSENTIIGNTVILFELLLVDFMLPVKQEKGLRLETLEPFL